MTQFDQIQRFSSKEKVYDVFHGLVHTRWSQYSLARESLLVFVWKVLNLLLAMGVGFVLARGLGPEKYGIYTYAMSWIALLSMPVGMGWPYVILREARFSLLGRNWADLRGLLTFAMLWIVVAGGIFVALVGLFFQLWKMDPARRQTIYMLLPLLWLYPLLGLEESLLKALNRIPRASFPFQNAFFLALILTLYGVGRLTLSSTIFAILVAYTMGAVVFGYWGIRFLRPEVWRVSPSYQPRFWARSAFALFVVSTLFALNGQIDVLMLGALRPSAEVGLYRLANRVAGMIGFFLMVANTIVSPRIMDFHENKEYEAMARFIRRAVRLAFLGSLGLFGIYLVIGQWILGLAGSVYRQAYATLLLMSVGQLVNVGAGSVGWVLSMTRHERDLVVSVGVSVALNIGLNLLLTPHWGYFGTAMATALAMLVWNVLLTLCVWHHFRVRVGIL